MKEIWKDIEGYEGLYQISNLGRVKSLRNNIILKQKFDKDRYCITRLSNNGTKKYYRTHRVVAHTFINNDNDKPQVNHIDGNKQNNCVDNLEWVTNMENVRHAYRIGLITEDMFVNPPRKVIQMDKNYNTLHFFDSIYEAGSILKINHSNISKACRKKLKTAGGYKWRYAE